MTYLPDTNACIMLLRQRDPKLIARWQAAKASEVVLCSVVVVDWLQATSSSLLQRGLDAVSIVYSLLSGHPASAVCESYLRNHSGWLTMTERGGCVVANLAIEGGRLPARGKAYQTAALRAIASDCGRCRFGASDGIGTRPIRSPRWSRKQGAPIASCWPR